MEKRWPPESVKRCVTPRDLSARATQRPPWTAPASVAAPRACSSVVATFHSLFAGLRLCAMGEVRIEERGGGVVVATLSNPPQGLMDFGIVDGLEALVERAETDEGLTGIVLTGAHPERFIAHFDVGELLAASRASPS